MTTLNPKIATPLYIQLADKIRNFIENGELKSGEQIMSERYLIEQYNVSRITVRKAIDLLVNEKILFRKQGKGTYVAYPDFFESAHMQGHSFTASFLKGTSVPYTKVLTQKTITAEDSLREKFDIPFSEQEFINIIRLRYVDDIPAVYELDYLPTRFRILLNMDLDNRSLYGILYEMFGINSTNFKDSFSIIGAKEPYSQLLNVEDGFPLLSVIQTVLDSECKTIYYNQQIINTKHYTYQVQSFL